MSDVKEIKITGDALKGQMGGKKRRSTRKKQDGGDNSGALMQLAAQSAPAGHVDPNAQKLMSEATSQVGQVLKTDFTSLTKQMGGMSTGAIVNLSSSRSATLPGSPEPSPVVSGVNPSQPGAVGGARLVLAPGKRKTRIALKAKKHGGSSSIEPLRAFMGGANKKTHKIHLRVKGITSRLNKAKKAKKMAMNAPISQIKSRLEKAGVIKSGSKAPESMLRNMYADLLITKKGL